MPVKKAKFFALRNLASDDILLMEEPWNYDTGKVPWGLSKSEWDSTYLGSGSTNHRLLSLCEGLVPGVRVDKDNEPCMLHGIIADYDGVLPGDFETSVADILAKAPSGYKPAWAAQSKSGKLHLVWMFEAPVRVKDSNHVKRFLEIALRKIKADRWGSALDLPATLDPSVYVDIGKKWVPMDRDYAIPTSVLNLWDFTMFEGILRKNKTAFGVEIPLREVLEEARRRGFRGMPMPFETGQHCRRFWDPDSDNDRGCQITDGGIIVYVPKDKPFMTWADIFGRAFVEQYEAKKFTAESSDLWWDGTDFWMRESDGGYYRQKLTDLSRKLRCQGLSQTISRGETSSEIDRFLVQVQEAHRVTAAECWMYFKPGLLRRENGDKVLNVSTMEVTRPAPPQWAAGALWGSPTVEETFPFIHGLIDHLFHGEIFPRVEDQPSQVDRFLWWISHFYRCAYYQRPEPGQALFMAGPAGGGKSFLTRHILPPLMGGVATDAGQHLTGGEKWTSQLIGSPFLNVDDDANINQGTHARYCQLVKKYVANAEMENQQKFRDTTSVPWFGRILVSCNLDQHSLAIIPDMSRSNRDKVTLLKTLNPTEKVYAGFGSFEDNKSRVRSELPFFARFLLDLDVPEQYRDPNKRFGVVAWQHPALLVQSEALDNITSLIEFMDLLWGRGGNEGAAKRARELRGSGQADSSCYWVGTASDLLNDISVVCPHVTREFKDGRTLGRELRRLADSGWDVTYIPGTANVYRWRIAHDVVVQGPDPRRKEKAIKGL